MFLCPLEAVRIRSVSDKAFPQSLPAGFAQMFKTEGITGFYSGIGPILFKQVPYTMAKFAVQGKSAEMIYTQLGELKTKNHAYKKKINFSRRLLPGQDVQIRQCGGLARVGCCRW